MKKAVLFTLLSFLFSCTEDEFPFPYNPDKPITGAWQRVSRLSVGYDTKTGAETYSNIDNNKAGSYLMLMEDGAIYLGSYTDEGKRMHVGTYQYTGDSIFFDSGAFLNKRQAVLELGREIMKLEYIRDDGSEDGTLDVVTETYGRREN